MGKYFGTDGIRGIANEQLSAEIAFKVGQYLGHCFPGDKILIGSDTRISKDMLKNALCAGLTSTGADVYWLGVVPTPCVSYLTKEKDFKAGIMISASHNPFYDNGIKIFNEFGEKIDEQLEQSIEEYLDGKRGVKLVTSAEIGTEIDYSKGAINYLDYLLSTVDSNINPFKLVVDCANGSASYLAQLLLEQINVEYDIIDNKPNGININVDCGSTHLANLKEVMQDKDYDLGIAFDGDADRMLAVDKEGNELDGDAIIYLCAKALKQKGQLDKNTVVTTVMANLGLYKALAKLDIDYVQTAVGDKYVYEAMKNDGYVLGGEQSGHIIFKKYASTGDGMLSMLQLLQALTYLDMDTDDLKEEFVKFPQVLKNIRVNDKEIIMNSHLIKEEIAIIEQELHGEGRVLLRPSGTEPLIRVMVEAKDIETCEKYVDFLIELIERI